MKIKYFVISFIFFMLTASLFGGKTASIIIDPGHGGKDTGVQGVYIKNGKEQAITEKDVALVISKKLHSVLKQEYPDIPVLLTRKDDTSLSFEKRANTISYKDKNNDTLFISIHSNSNLDTSVNGFKVFVNVPNKKNTLLANSVCEGLNKTIGSKMKNLGVSEFPFPTKNRADVIVEVGFLSNQSDILLLSDDEFLLLCANGIAKGIKAALAGKI